MDTILTVALVGGVELLARVITLLLAKDKAAPRTLTYRTWVLLVVLVPFAWAAYLLAGLPRKG